MQDVGSSTARAQEDELLEGLEEEFIVYSPQAQLALSSSLTGDDAKSGLSPYLHSRSKRALDLLISVPLLLAALPLVVLLAIGSAISLRAWPFFVQDRVGRDGRTFRMVKIRSLPVSSPEYATKYVINRMGTTRFGSFLRKSHLDELPQLALVALGRMSLVGPRPEMRVLCDDLDPAFVEMRTCVRPGCAGLWQLSDDAGRLIGEVPHYDLAYLKEASLRFDLMLLWGTLRMMVGLRRAGLLRPAVPCIPTGMTMAFAVDSDSMVSNLS